MGFKTKATHYAAHVRHYTIVVSDGTKDVLVVVNRSEELVDVEYQVWAGKIYKKEFAKSDLKRVAKFIEMAYPHYEVQVAKDNFKDLLGCSADQFSSISMTMAAYARVNKLFQSSALWKASFAPTKYEEENFHPEFEGKTYAEAVREGRALRGRLGTVFRDEKKKFQRRQVVAFDDAVSQLTNMTTMGQMNYRTMDNYLWLRHEIFSMQVAAALNIQASKTDRMFKEVEEFGLVDWAHHNNEQTPDFIFEHMGEWIVLECAVTDGQAPTTYARKINKYNAICHHLSRQINKPVRLCVMIMSRSREVVCNSADDMFLQALQTEFEMLKNLMAQVERLDSYESVRRLFDLVEPNEMAGPILKMSTARTDLMNFVCTSDLELKSLGFLRSFGADGFDKPENPAALGVVDANKEWNAIEAVRLDKGAAFSEDEFVSKLIHRHAEKEYSHELKKLSSQTVDSAVEHLDKLMEAKKRIKTKRKTPKWLKLPVPPVDSEGVSLPIEHQEKYSLSDGAYILEPAFAGFPEKAPGSKETAGLPVDIGAIEDLSTSVESLMETIGNGPHKSISEMFENTHMGHVFEMMTEISYELMLLTNRRFAVQSSSRQAVFKEHEKFSLMIAEGPMLNDGNQCIFKVMIRSDTGPVYNHISKKFTPFQENDLFDITENHYSTGWLSLQLADLIHFAVLSDRTRVILTDTWTRGLESKTFDKSELAETKMPDFFMMPLIMLGEHKRNTMTCAQLSRYLMHSSTAVISDFTALSDEIFEMPIRSVPNMMVVYHQHRWFRHMLLNQGGIKDYLIRSTTNDPRNDTFTLPSIYTPGLVVDFQLTMFEIYYGNMFNVHHGFRSHRDKEIMQKIIDLEDHYRGVLKEKTLEGSWETMFFGKDKKCTYSPAFLKKAFQFYLSKPENKVLVQQASQHMMEQGLGKLLKMTRSVLGALDDFGDFMEMAPGENNQRVTVFEAVLDTLEKVDMVKLESIVKSDEVTYAIFTTFNKPQHGKGREILIQAIRTRIHTTMMNSFFEYLCKSHAKDMTTKEGQKREIQSSSVLNYHNEATETNVNREDRSAFTFMINSDASKWAQSMVMMTYTFFINHEESPMHSNLKKFFTSMYASYSNKFIYIPDSLQRKISEWSESMVEGDPVIARATAYASMSGLMLIHSGMGQGNFQHGSGFIACLVDDYSDHLTDKVMNCFGVTLRSTTLISSDDSTKLYYFECDTVDMTPGWVTKMLYMIVDIFTGTRKMSNIHINWKKTALQMIITEFNSVFTIMKRVYTASIKDSYNSIAIPDMSRPEEAVKEMLSSIRRLVDCGCYLETIELALKTARCCLAKWYGYTPEKVRDLMHTLECTVDDLPFNLGFVPVSPPYEVLLYGPEVKIPRATGKLKEFYEGIYSVPPGREDLEDQDTDANCKYTLEVGGRTDAQLIGLKQRTAEAVDHEYEFWKEVMMATPFSKSVLLLDFRNYLRSYIDSVKRTYGFSASYRFHSLVRGLQLWKTCVFTKDRKETFTLMAGVEELINKPNEETYLPVFNSLSMIMDEADATKENLRHARKSMFPNRHAKTRKLSMYKRNSTDTSAPEDVIQSVLDPNPVVKSRYGPQVEEIANMIGIKMADLTSDPVTHLIKKFGAMPFSRLSEYCRWFCKLYEVKFVDIISEFPTSWNRRLDISGLYRYKTDPTFVLSNDEEENESNLEKKYDNAMVFARLNDLTTEEMSAHEPVTRKGHAFKMMSSCTKSNMADGNNVTLRFPSYNYAESHPMFTSTPETRVWYSGNCLVELLMKRNGPKMVEIKIYGVPDGAIIPLVKKEVSRISLSDRSLKFRWRDLETGNEEVADYTRVPSINLNQIKRFRLNRPTLSVTRTAAAWSVKIEIFARKFNLWTGNHSYHPGLSFKPEYDQKMSNINDLTASSCTLTEIDDLLKELPGFVQNKITEKGANQMPGELMAAVWSIEAGAGNPFDFLGAEEDSDSDDDNLVVDLNLFNDSPIQSIMDQELLDAITTPGEVNLITEDYSETSLISKTMRTVVRAVREEVNSNLKEIRRQNLPISEAISLLVAVIRRDLKRQDDDQEFSDMLLLLVASALLKSSMLSLGFRERSPIRHISEQKIAGIHRYSMVSPSISGAIHEALS